MQDLKPWKILTSDYVVDSKFIRVRKDSAELPNGGTCEEYYVVEKPCWAAVFYLREDGKLLLNRQYKHGIGEVVIELPAGGIDPNEEPEVAAAREFEEETGHKAEKLEFLNKFIVDPSMENRHGYLYFTDSASQGEKQEDDQEEIENIFVDLKDVKKMIEDGEISAINHIAMIYHTISVKNLEW